MLKSKKFLSLIISVVMIFLMFAQTGIVSVAEEDDILSYLTYEIKNGEVIITDFDKSVAGRIELPEKIKGYPVTQIGPHAFLHSALSYVEFPDTLKEIGFGAFWNSRLEVVSIPDSVEKIGDDAFGYCGALKGIYTGKNITEISPQMLRGNSALFNVFIGKKVKEIGFWGFEASKNIKNIYFEGTEEEWKKIVVSDNGNDVLKTAKITFNCTDDSYSVCQPAKYDEELQMGYSINLGEVTIDYTSSYIEDECVIPETIEGFPVTTIGFLAFNFEPDMKSLSIPSSVNCIEGVFLEQCFNIENIYVDDKNEYYVSEDGNLFNKDKTELIRYAIGNGRQEYTIPDTVITIRNGAFTRIYRTLKLNIPASVTNIEKEAFNSAHHLYYINVDENNPAYLSDDGVLFNKDKTILLCFPALRFGAYIEDGIDTTKESYIIPDGVKELGDFAFSCSALKSVEMPDSVERIGRFAFYWCKNLESVEISENVRNIEAYAFFDSALTSIDIPDSAITIGTQAFASSANLSEIQIGNNIKSIGSNAFAGTEYYKNADNWKDKALYIGNYLIEVNDDTITEFTVKDGTRNIAYAAFSWCYNLKKINLPDSLKAVSDYGFAFNLKLEKVVIPEGVTEIGNAAFSYCESLSEVSIPESVTKIGKGVFYESGNLKKINYAGDKAGWNNIEIAAEENDWSSYITVNCEKEPVQEPTTQEPTTQEPVESMSGDLDGNRKITAADARLALRIAAKLETGNNHQLMVADMNKDGKITAADARKILRISAKLER